MATVELIDPNGYTVETAYDVADTEVAATEIWLATVAVRDAAKWADFPGYRAQNYRTRVS